MGAIRRSLTRVLHWFTDQLLHEGLSDHHR